MQNSKLFTTAVQACRGIGLFGVCVFSFLKALWIHTQNIVTSFSSSTSRGWEASSLNVSEKDLGSIGGREDLKGTLLGH